MTPLIVAVFMLVYAGMATGHVPGLRIDRTGVAIIGAIILYAAGAIDTTAIHQAIDYATLVLLFGLMVLSAQFSASEFYDWCAWRIAHAKARPPLLLGLTVVAAGGLSALLANDIVVFAMAPILCHALAARRIDPRPFLIALAGGANAGSAATLIGNPQNILIGQAGALDFWTFATVCAPPAVVSLAVVYGVIRLVWHRELTASAGLALPEPAAPPRPALNKTGLIKASTAAVTLLILFTTPLPYTTSALIIAAALLISRHLPTREMLAMVDWPLLLLIAALFIITNSLNTAGLLDAATTVLQTHGIEIADLTVIAVLSLVAGNTVGNVPGVMLILSAAPDLPVSALYALAVFSTLAGNLLIVGSLANIIVVERARTAGVHLGFSAHAKCGIPITLVSGVVAYLWFSWLGL